MTHTELLIGNQAVKELLDSIGFKLEYRRVKISEKAHEVRWFLSIKGEDIESYPAANNETQQYQEAAKTVLNKHTNWTG